MKNQFIRRDGLLFLKCEPEPLPLRTQMPCLVRYIQDDSPMGQFNKLLKEESCYNLDNIYIYDVSALKIVIEHMRYEIIAKPCPKGSVGWGLWMMLNGEKITNSKSILYNEMIAFIPYGVYGDENTIYTKTTDNKIRNTCGMEEWLLTYREINDWKIYKDKDLKVGKWYIYDNTHYRCEGISYVKNQKAYQMRAVGVSELISFPEQVITLFVESSIIPDLAK